MHFLLPISFFLLLSSTLNYSTVKSFDFQSIKDDLTKFDKSCTEANCENYKDDSFSYRACHCGIHCVQLGTCCFDSPYANIPKPDVKPACRSVHKSNAYFIVDQCPSNDSMWADMCHDEDILDEDVSKIVPVTSLVTSITYKNYYCFRCHETTEQFVYWNLKVKSKYELWYHVDDISFTYRKKSDTVMSSYGDEESYWYFVVNTTMEIPSEIMNLTYICVPNITSDCPDDWSDEEVRIKCRSYMALREVKDELDVFTYKNIHCALCNNKSLSDIKCRTISRGNYDYKEIPSGGHGERFSTNKRRPGKGYSHFTFTLLLDINPSDGELVGKVQKCSEDHQWDHIRKQCRKLTCALPGFKIKDGQCIPEQS